MPSQRCLDCDDARGSERQPLPTHEPQGKTLRPFDADAVRRVPLGHDPKVRPCRRAGYVKRAVEQVSSIPKSEAEGRGALRRRPALPSSGSHAPASASCSFALSFRTVGSARSCCRHSVPTGCDPSSGSRGSYRRQSAVPEVHFPLSALMQLRLCRGERLVAPCSLPRPPNQIMNSNCSYISCRFRG